MNKTFILITLVLLIQIAILPAQSIDAELSKGVNLYNQRQYAQAVQVLSNGLVKAGANNAAAPSYYYYLACCYYQLRQNEEAKKLYVLVTNRFPRSSEAALSLTMLRQLMPQTDAIATAMPTNAVMESTHVSRAIPVQAEVPGLPAIDETEYSNLPEQVKIYFKRADNSHMLVDTFINNHPIKAWFDTGASTHVGMNHLRAAGVELPKGDPTGVVGGWAGRGVPIWKMPCNVKMGNMTRRLNITVEEQMDLLPLIGQDFIRGYQYEIDDRGGCMYLRKNSVSQIAHQTNNLYDVPCTKEGKDDFVPLEVNSRKCTAFIDTGAARTIINPRTLAQLHIEIPADAPVYTMSGVGGSTRMYQVMLDLRLGPIIRKDFPVMVGGAAGNAIGQDFLEGWRFTVDQDKHLMKFFH